MKPKILFVDDSLHVLNSLRLNLRTKRQVWDMTFACGGIEAVQKLEAEPFDVLVTDLRMPELDGTELLRIAHERYPHMARIVLSGYAEENSALKNMALSHHYLSKPCNTELLIKTINDLLPCRDVPLSPEMRKLISGLQSLPALSGTYTELQSALKDDSVSIRELCGIMEKGHGHGGNGASRGEFALFRGSFPGIKHRVCRTALGSTDAALHHDHNAALFKAGPIHQS